MSFKNTVFFVSLSLILLSLPKVAFANLAEIKNLSFSGCDDRGVRHFVELTDARLIIKNKDHIEVNVTLADLHESKGAELEEYQQAFIAYFGIVEKVFNATTDTAGNEALFTLGITPNGQPIALWGRHGAITVRDNGTCN